MPAGFPAVSSAQLLAEGLTQNQQSTQITANMGTSSTSTILNTATTYNEDPEMHSCKNLTCLLSQRLKYVPRLGMILCSVSLRTLVICI